MMNSHTEYKREILAIDEETKKKIIHAATSEVNWEDTVRQILEDAKRAYQGVTARHWKDHLSEGYGLDSVS